jgi:hypothetical protein
MTEKTKQFLEKYNPENIFTPVLEHYDSSIRGDSFVVICPKMITNPDIKKESDMKRGQDRIIK